MTLLLAYVKLRKVKIGILCRKTEDVPQRRIEVIPLDKFEYRIRAEEIKTLIAQGEYVEAVKIADTIDWRRVKSIMMLCTISDLYKINRRFEESKELLLMAYERHPGGRTIVYSLCELSIKMEEYVQAIEYYKEFVQIAPRDSGRYILQYKLYEAQDVSLEERIAVLEELKKRDYREKWAYELAYLYHRIGLSTKCVEECDELALWFGEGKYVIKAMELKMLHQPLTPEQEKRYEMQMQGISIYERYEEDEEGPEEDAVLNAITTRIDSDELDDIHVKTLDMGQYNTINLQKELAASMKELLDDGSEVDESLENSGADSITKSIIAPLFENTEEIEAASQAALNTDVKRPSLVQEEVFFGETGEIGEMPEEDPYGDSEYREAAGGNFSYTEGTEGVADLEESEDLEERDYLEESEDPEETGYEEEPEDLEETGYEEEPEDLEETGYEEEPEDLEETGYEEEPEDLEETGYEEEPEDLEETGYEEEPEDLEESGYEEESGDLEERIYEEGPENFEKRIYDEGSTDLEEIIYDEDTDDLKEPAYEEEPEDLEEADDGEGFEDLRDVDDGEESEDLGETTANTSAAVMQQMREEAEKTSAQKEINSATYQILPEVPAPLAGMLSQEYDGQISLVVPEGEKVEKQITGQMSIQDILAEWERMKKDNEEKRKEDVRRRVKEQTGNMFAEFDESTRSGILAQLDELDAAVKEKEAQKEQVTYSEDEAEYTGEDTEESLQTDEEEILSEDSGELLLEESTEETAEESSGETGETEESTGEPAPLSAEEPETSAEEEVTKEEGEETKAVKEESQERPAAKPAKKKTVPAREEDLEDIVDERMSLRQLTEEEKELFGAYIHTRKAKEQFIKSIDSISMAAYTGNIIVTGDDENDTRTLAKNLVREVQASDNNFSGRVAKISGASLNKKDVEATVSRMENGALIIEGAAKMSAETVSKLYKYLDHENKGIIVVITGTKKEINKFLKQNDTLKSCFTARFDIEALDDDALTAYGRKYAELMEYSIDELGMLALHTRISDMQTSTHIVNVAEVQEIVDEAIDHANRKNITHFFDILLAKRYDDEDMIILRERDFN